MADGCRDNINLMNLNKQIASQFRDVHIDGTWIATNYKAELSEISWQVATTKVGSLNTIAALTYHINYYLAGVLEVFDGGTLTIKDKYSFDLPPITSQKEWEDLQNQMWANTEKLTQHLNNLNSDQLMEGFAGGQYGSNYRNITGMIEHAYYHLGQIVIIKKLLKENK